MNYLQASAVLVAITIPSIAAVRRAPRESPAIAIVDAQYISTASKWARTNHLDHIDEESRRFAGVIQKITLDVERLKRDQVLLKSESHKWNLKQTEIQTLVHRRKLLGQTYQMWMDREVAKASRTIYGRIQEMVAVVCKKQGLDLVFKKSGTRVKSANQKLRDSNRLDLLIYASAKLDITDAVLKLVDNADVREASTPSNGGPKKAPATGDAGKDGKKDGK